MYNSNNEMRLYNNKSTKTGAVAGVDTIWRFGRRTRQTGKKGHEKGIRREEGPHFFGASGSLHLVFCLGLAVDILDI